MSDQTYLAALAGLLHDIGKFTLRAAEAGNRTWDREAQGDFKYKHAMLTASFVERYVPEVWQTEVSLAAGNHHRAQRREDLVITLADILSAAERDDGTKDEDVKKEHPKQLRSISSALVADKQPLPKNLIDRSYLPLAALELKREALFPDKALEGDSVWQAYNRLYQDFTAAAQSLKQAHEPEGDLPTYLESLLLLMQRYTWAIPSAYYKAVPDISLYDHSRMTAALAAVLAETNEQTLRSWKDSLESVSDDVALLIGGDISGVQDFIYTISSRGATSALRGRSFYLQMLTEAIVRYVLRELNLPITNLIYAGGGNFYLLARPADRDLLPAIQRRISQVLLHHHRGELFAALESMPLTAADFFDGKVSSTWGRLTERLRRAKLRRFSELGDDLRQVFNPQGHGGNRETQCQVCGVEHDDMHEDTNDEGTIVRKCPACWSYEILGDTLRQGRYLLLEVIHPTDVDTDGLPGGCEEALAALGLRVQIIERPSDLRPTANGRRVLLALKDDVVRDLMPSAHTAIGRRLLVNVIPSLGNQVKPFDKLQEESQGIKRLGVLRMDVDNLGKLFSEGLEDRATLSRVASLSFAISLYFEGWVEKLAEEHIPSGRLYSIYSGGDDLFFVGSWDAVVEFARQVRADLTRYAAGHPGIHASAGIALVGGKYPLYQAAQDAGYAEDRAKDYRQAGRHDKDALCFLGQAQSWERFGLEMDCAGGFDTVHQLAHQLADLTDERFHRKPAPAGLIRDLLGQYEQYAEEETKRREAGRDVTHTGNPQALWGPWMWRSIYLLTRMADRTKGEKEVRDDILALRTRLWQEDFRTMEWMGLAARWAELLTR